MVIRGSGPSRNFQSIPAVQTEKYYDLDAQPLRHLLNLVKVLQIAERHSDIAASTRSVGGRNKKEGERMPAWSLP